jgi:hypothetical protein
MTAVQYALNRDANHSSGIDGDAKKKETDPM